MFVEYDDSALKREIEESAHLEDQSADGSELFEESLFYENECSPEPPEELY